MWNPTDSLPLTVEQKQTWEAWIRAKTTPRRTVLGSRICLLAAEGKANHAIAHHLDTSRPTALLWRKRFKEAGPSGLSEDAPHGPSAHRLALQKVKAIVEATLQTTPPDATHWSTRTMANAQEEAMPAWRGSGTRTASTLDQDTPQGVARHLILDNSGTHRHPNVNTWLAEHPRVHLHVTPTSVSWLNLVERWFGEITRKRIRRGVFKNVPVLVAAIDEFIRLHNKNPKPFVWINKVEDILAKTNRCKAVSETLQLMQLNTKLA